MEDIFNNLIQGIISPILLIAMLFAILSAISGGNSSSVVSKTFEIFIKLVELLLEMIKFIVSEIYNAFKISYANNKNRSNESNDGKANTNTIKSTKRKKYSK